MELVIGELTPMLKGFVKVGKIKETQGGTTVLRTPVELTGEDRACDRLAGEPMRIDMPSREPASLPLRLFSLLLNLELKGIVKQTEGRRFCFVYRTGLANNRRFVEE